MDRKPIEFRQLCVLVKTALLQDPTIDDAEWKARVRDTMARWGFEAPNPGTLEHAMTQVEHAVRRTLGPRPTPGPRMPSPAQRPEIPKEARTTRPLGWDLVARLMRTLRAGSAGSVNLPAPLGGPRETFAVTEHEALAEFWRAAGRDDADRLALLRTFAEIAIVRGPDWDPARIRAHAKDHRLSSDRCFVCRSNELADWHHVIQIQHGGSNYLRNRVALCRTCHAAVHPWLSSSRPLTGWTPLAECGGEVQAVMSHWKKAAS